MSSSKQDIFSVTFSKITTKKLKNIARQNAEENLIRDLKPILQVSQIFGIAPYSINRRNFTWSRNKLIYSGIFFGLCLYVYIKRIQIFLSKVLPLKVTLTYILIMISSAICVIMDTFTCVFHDNKHQEFLNYIIQYDVSTRYENRIKNRFVNWSWCGLIGFFLIIFTTEIFSWNLENNPGLAAASVLIFCSTLSLAVFKFIAFAIVLYLRFQDLNGKVEKDLDSSTTAEDFNRKYHFREVWQHHEYLLSAGKTLNSIYSTKLLIWFSIIFFTCVLQIFGVFSRNCNFFVVSNHFLISLIFILLLLSVTSICDLTASEANKMGKLVTSPKFFQRFTTTEKQDICLIGQYFHFNTFYFTAFGLFNVELNVLLTVASTMTTYLIILMSPNER